MQHLAVVIWKSEPDPNSGKKKVVPPLYPRIDATQSQRSIPRIHEGIDVQSQFPILLAQSMAATAEPNCSSKDLE